MARCHPSDRFHITASRRSTLKAMAGAALLGASAAAPARVGADAGPGPESIAGRGQVDSDRKEFSAKAIYLDPRITTEREEFEALLALIDRTELNALVLDIKEIGVYYDTDVAFFQDAGAVTPRYDLTDYLRALKERDIYAIARLVSFKDPITPLARPDLAVTDEVTGEIWRDGGEETWLNPFAEEVWEATTDLAREAAELGFDEVQFDYVRLPDGNIRTANFGPVPYTYEARTGAIAAFLGMGKEKLAPLGAKVSADIFGYTLLVQNGDDLGIGQDPAVLAPVVDYLCPMVYPSHFPEGSLAVEGHPNDFPHETIEISLGLGEAKLPGEINRFRPWLQDFSLPGLREYTAEDVRAQIDAAEEIGSGGWMIWDPNNRYQEAAFSPAE